MKQILILLLTISSFSILGGQNVIDKHFQSLTEQEDATNVSVTGKMFEMINSINVEVDSEEEEDIMEMKEFLGSIRSFQLVAANSMTNTRSYFDKSNKTLSSEYEELLSVNDKEGNFTLYIDEHNGTVHEVVGIGTDNEKLMVFSLLGDMKLEHVGKVAEHINETGMGHMSKVKDLDIGEVKVYPNPASSYGILNLETSEGFAGGVATLYDANGSSIRTYKINNTEEALELDNLTPGNYVLKITQGEVSVKKKVLVVR